MSDEKQIEELIQECAKVMAVTAYKKCMDIPLPKRTIHNGVCSFEIPCCASCKAARALIAEGWRKQNEAHDTGECRIFKCSRCGYGVIDIYQEDERNYPVAEFCYCPNCGAKMKGGE